MLHTILTSIGFLTASAIALNSFATECSSYEKMQAKLENKYGEQRIFSGFADSEKSSAANAVYEFWANPKEGNWSLIANKLVIFEYSSGSVNKNCVSIIDSGKRHHLVVATRQEPDLESDKLNQSSEPATEPSSLYNCIPRGLHAQALKKRHDEEPMLQALTDDKALVEIYSSGASWTITRVKAREVRDMMTGTPLTDTATGQEIHQFCSSPSYSGKSWGLHPIQMQSI